MLSKTNWIHTSSDAFCRFSLTRIFSELHGSHRCPPPPTNGAKGSAGLALDPRWGQGKVGRGPRKCCNFLSLLPRVHWSTSATVFSCRKIQGGITSAKTKKFTHWKTHLFKKIYDLSKYLYLELKWIRSKHTLCPNNFTTIHRKTRGFQSVNAMRAALARH